MFIGVSVPAILIGIVTLFWLVDAPRDARWLNAQEKQWLIDKLEREHAAKQNAHLSVRTVLGNGRVWMLCLIYFGFIYGLYAPAFFLPTIIGGFQQQFGTTFNVMQKGLITGAPYLVAAVVMFLWSRDASRRGCKTWHIALPALAGGISVPLVLYMNLPLSTMLVIAVTASSIFAALPNFWTLPTQFLSGASAAATIALINTLGNLASFSAGYITGVLHDATQSYTLPMMVVGGFMLLSALLMLLLNRRRVEPLPSSLAQEH